MKLSNDSDWLSFAHAFFSLLRHKEKFSVESKHSPQTCFCKGKKFAKKMRRKVLSVLRRTKKEGTGTEKVCILRQRGFNQSLSDLATTMPNVIC